MKEAAAKKSVGQFFFVVGCNEYQRAVFGLDEFAGFVAVELHAVDLSKQVVWKLNVGFVDFINQKRHRLVGSKGLPQDAFNNVVVNILDPLTAINI